MHDLARLLQNLESGDDEQAERAALALGALGQEALEPLLGLLRAGDTEARWWSARTLALIRHPQATQALISCLADTDAGVRQ
jgi:HEAT repeat protein